MWVKRRLNHTHSSSKYEFKHEIGSANRECIFLRVQTGEFMAKCETSKVKYKGCSLSNASLPTARSVGNIQKLKYVR